MTDDLIAWSDILPTLTDLAIFLEGTGNDVSFAIRPTETGWLLSEIGLGKETDSAHDEARLERIITRLQADIDQHLASRLPPALSSALGLFMRLRIGLNMQIGNAQPSATATISGRIVIIPADKDGLAGVVDPQASKWCEHVPPRLLLIRTRCATLGIDPDRPRQQTLLAVTRPTGRQHERPTTLVIRAADVADADALTRLALEVIDSPTEPFPATMDPRQRPLAVYRFEELERGTPTTTPDPTPGASPQR